MMMALSAYRDCSKSDSRAAGLWPTLC